MSTRTITSLTLTERGAGTRNPVLNLTRLIVFLSLLKVIHACSLPVFRTVGLFPFH